eukprot:SM003100S12260  [mRNA]  locus=s3100:5:1336:- [translate_table: standard]
MKRPAAADYCRGRFPSAAACSAAATAAALSTPGRSRQMSVTLHTNLGDIKCEIFCDEVPKAAENFLALCASGYYEGTIFHRNIKGFMIQGGDPTGTGRGGTSIWSRKFNDEIREALKHTARGILSMANSGPNTNGSQFFISYAKQPHLNGLYTVFGRIIAGLEVLDLMEKVSLLTCKQVVPFLSSPSYSTSFLPSVPLLPFSQHQAQA